MGNKTVRTAGSMTGAMLLAFGVWTGRLKQVQQASP